MFDLESAKRWAQSFARSGPFTTSLLYPSVQDLLGKEKREGIRYIREKRACLFDFPASNDGYIHSLNFLVYPFHFNLTAERHAYHLPGVCQDILAEIEVKFCLCLDNC